MDELTSVALPKQTPEWLALECYTEDEVLAGRIRWPIGLRLLDLLNSLYATPRESGGDFLDFIDVSKSDESVSTFISKSSVGMVTISDSNLARGAGAEPAHRYPYVRKLEVEVSLKLKTHLISGTMHLAEKETIQDVLNRDSLFIPITSATIVTADNRFYGTRPFIAVNKRHIVWARVEK
jgi:hypothetical protein